MNPSPQSVAARGSSEVTAVSRFRYPTLVAIFIPVLLLAVSAGAATLTVTSPADAGGSCPGADCTLRQAVATANAGDTIDFFLPANTAITLTSAQISITKNVAITGPGADLVTVQRDSAATAAKFRIFGVNLGVVASISGLTIANGTSEGGAGGGILNQGNLTLTNASVSGNSAFDGGGIYSSGTSTVIRNCTIANNSADRRGGGVANIGKTMEITHCTITGNTGPGDGGGIHTNTGSVLTISNSTIAGNSAGSGSGGGIENLSGSVNFKSTIIASNTAATGPDLRNHSEFGASITSQGYNLVGDGTASSIAAATGDQIGTTATPINPILGPLQDNGGPTKTRLPLSGSTAIDKGHANGAPFDQRGFARPVDRVIANAPGGDGSDIGAVELSQAVQQTGPTFTVTTTLERDLGQCATDDCSLIEALNLTNAVADPNTINFASGVVGVIKTATLTPSGLAITNPVTINGPGARMLLIKPDLMGRAFLVTSSNVRISGLTVFNGRVNDDNGGAIHNTGGLTLTDCLIEDNAALSSTGVDTQGLGGGIYNGTGASLELIRCTLHNNTATRLGAGVFNDGMLTATNCTFSANIALQGGGIYSSFNNNTTKVSLRNCTITKCQSSSTGTAGGDGGGGLHMVGNNGQYHLGNCIVAGNLSSANPSTNPDIRGNFTSDGHNLVGNVGFSTGFSNNVNGDQVGTPGAPKPPSLGSLTFNGGPIITHPLLSSSTAINAGDDGLAPPADQRGYQRTGVSDIGAFEFQGLIPVTLANISTRLRVETGDNVLIGGFIITGTKPKKVIIRAIGPSLNLPGQLANPTLELRNSAGTLLASNDDWMNSSPADKQAIIDSTIPPSNDLESAIVATLPANAASYTAIVRGANNGTGIGVVEAYDLDRTVDSKLANISTRGLVQTGDNVLIAGTIVLGSASQKVIIRAIGPSLPIAGKLENPTLELRDGSGTLLEANDNWVESPNKQAIIDSTIPPGNDLESAIVRTLSPANYTAIVRGVGDTTGIAVVEVYSLQ